MHPSKIVFLINDDVRAVSLEYEPECSQTTAKTLDPNLKVDDFVVVESGTRHEMTVAKVKKVDVDIDMDGGTNIPWVLQKVDTEGHQQVLDLERQAIETVNRAEKARKKKELRKALFEDAEDQMQTLQLTNIKDAGEEPVTE